MSHCRNPVEKDVSEKSLKQYLICLVRNNQAVTVKMSPTMGEGTPLPEGEWAHPGSLIIGIIMISIGSNNWWHWQSAWVTESNMDKYGPQDVSELHCEVGLKGVVGKKYLEGHTCPYLLLSSSNTYNNCLCASLHMCECKRDALYMELWSQILICKPVWHEYM